MNNVNNNVEEVRGYDESEFNIGLSGVTYKKKGKSISTKDIVVVLSCIGALGTFYCINQSNKRKEENKKAIRLAEIELEKLKLQNSKEDGK